MESERERRREEGNVPRLTLAEGGVFVCLRYFPLFPRAVFPSRKRRPRNSAYHTGKTREERRKEEAGKEGEAKRSEQEEKGEKRMG